MAETFPTTIDEVLTELDLIIEDSIRNNDARGIFAYVYRRTTAEVKLAIDANEFGNSQALHLFDVAFANYYFNAYRQFCEGEECSLVWSESFDGCKDGLSIVQHILLGMNAHINLDLGVAAAVISKGKDINDLEADFMLVNGILARIVNNLQQRLSRVSPLFFVMDWLGRNNDEKLINFSMNRARAQAWQLALSLHDLDDDAFRQKYKTADQGFALFAKQLRQPNSRLVRWVLLFISRFEEKDVGRVIEKMRR